MKQPISVRLDVDLLDRAKNAAKHIGCGMTLTGLIETGLLSTVQALEAKHNKGKHFTKREGELPKSPKKS